MSLKIKSIGTVEIPEDLSGNLALARAYAAGVVRTKEPELLEQKEYAPLRQYDQKFFARTHDILVNCRSCYEKAEGKEFMALARAYSRGVNVDRKQPGRFDPAKLEKVVKWTQINSRAEPRLVTNSGRDTVTVINRHHQDLGLAGLEFTAPNGMEIYHDGLSRTDPEYNDVNPDIGRINSWASGYDPVERSLEQ